MEDVVRRLGKVWWIEWRGGGSDRRREVDRARRRSMVEKGGEMSWVEVKGGKTSEQLAGWLTWENAKVAVDGGREASRGKDGRYK